MKRETTLSKILQVAFIPPWQQRIPPRRPTSSFHSDIYHHPPKSPSLAGEQVRQYRSHRRWRPPCVSSTISAVELGVHSHRILAMEIQRIRLLMLLTLRSLSSRVALVGGNHTAARFCTR
ncbi:hypothetical protein KSP40_PGU001858 [Platanthera guangdongensis]|uniref:Uncharacterized protein n=1 Tax=Platanthera guangdongensis TaxID=2320717 RepID=A0ABR2LN89_9ASPA